MSKQPGILKVIHAVSDVQQDPAEDESLFADGTLDSFTLPTWSPAWNRSSP